MGLYDRYLLPRLVELACGSKPQMRQRVKVVPLARGRVLEIGFGTGLNLPHYDADQVTKLWALDPSPGMWALAEERLAGAAFPVERLEAGAEEIPLPAHCADCAVVTYTLCSLPRLLPALGELRRVLRPGGELLFSEHGAAPDPAVRAWQDRLNGPWRLFSGGCNLNLPIPELLGEGGFELAELQAMYLPGWRPASYNYWGRAVAP